MECFCYDCFKARRLGEIAPILAHLAQTYVYLCALRIVLSAMLFYTPCLLCLSSRCRTVLSSSNVVVTWHGVPNNDLCHNVVLILSKHRRMVNVFTTCDDITLRELYALSSLTTIILIVDYTCYISVYIYIYIYIHTHIHIHVYSSCPRRPTRAGSGTATA